MILPDGRVESCGNFHGAPLGLACDLLAMARRRRRRDLRAPHGPPPRREPLGGPAAFPRRGPGRQFGADDRPVHAGGDGRREPPARGSRPGSTRCRRARCRRTTSRWAGARRGSCESPLDNLRRILAVEARLRRAGARPSRPARAGSGDRRGPGGDPLGGRPGPGRGPPPRPGARGGGAADRHAASSRRPSRARSGSCGERPPPGPCAPRRGDLLPGAGSRRRPCGC